VPACGDDPGDAGLLANGQPDQYTLMAVGDYAAGYAAHDDWGAVPRPTPMLVRHSL
jgi:hypothetical protein